MALVFRGASFCAESASKKPDFEVVFRISGGSGDSANISMVRGSLHTKHDEAFPELEKVQDGQEILLGLSEVIFMGNIPSRLDELQWLHRLFRAVPYKL